MKYKILIFDLDDTLIDNTENTKSAFETMLAACGEKFSDAEFSRWYEIDRQFWIDWQDDLIEIPKNLKHETGKKSDEFLDWVRSQRVLRYFDDSISAERAIELNNIYMQSLNDTVVPIEGVRDTLEYLSEKYKIVIATNGPNVATQKKLEKIDSLQFVAEVLSADMFGFMKPRIEFFKAIEERYSNFSLNDYLIIGDSLKSDVGFGMNAGIDSCWFNANNDVVADGYSPTYTIQHLTELKSLL